MYAMFNAIILASKQLAEMLSVHLTVHISIVL
jgi:hypothetical protein